MKLYKRINVLNESGLDLNSCILLLKEVFNQWMEPKVSFNYCKLKIPIPIHFYILDTRFSITNKRNDKMSPRGIRFVYRKRALYMDA